MKRLKLKCVGCGSIIENSASRYRQYCDNCYELNKEGGLTNMTKNKEATVDATAKISPKTVKTERIELADKVLNYMKSDLAISETELLKVHFQMWLKLKGRR